jgi:hypothetical protein
MKKTLLLLSFLLFSLAGFSQNPYTPTPYDPANPYAADGNFVRNHATGQIYVIMEGKLRYIQTPATLDGLFVGAADNLVEYTSAAMLYTFPIGTAVSQDSGFVDYTPTGQFYLREGNLLRYIANPAVAHLYHFNFSIAVNKTSYAGYVLGSYLTN